jgi:hypothetical protein
MGYAYPDTAWQTMKPQDGKSVRELRQADEGDAPVGMNDSSSAVLVTRTLRLKVTPEGYAWLNVAAMEVNTVWNWANEISGKTVMTCARRRQWLRGFDLNNLSFGGMEVLQEHWGGYDPACERRIRPETSSRHDDSTPMAYEQGTASVSRLGAVQGCKLKARGQRRTLLQKDLSALRAEAAWGNQMGNRAALRRMPWAIGFVPERPNCLSFFLSVPSTLDLRTSR